LESYVKIIFSRRQQEPDESTDTDDRVGRRRGGRGWGRPGGRRSAGGQPEPWRGRQIAAGGRAAPQGHRARHHGHASRRRGHSDAGGAAAGLRCAQGRRRLDFPTQQRRAPVDAAAARPCRLNSSSGLLR